VNPALLFGVLIALLLLGGLLAPRRLPEFVLITLLILIPISITSYAPRMMLGIRGLNPVNVVWLLALGIAVTSVMKGEVESGLRKYFSIPVIALMLLYGVAYLRTFIGIDELTSYDSFSVNRATFTLGFLIKPFQVFITGWIVSIFCRKRGNDDIVYKSILLSACIYASVVLFVFLKYSVSAGSYVEGREGLTANMGTHANSVGALGVYFLFFGLMSREKVGKLLRLFGVLAALLIIALSFSRMAYLTTLILFAFFYRSLPAIERRFAIVAGILVVSIFSAQIIQRIGWGYSEESVEAGRTVDAGRIHGIWLPLLPQVEKRPVIGSGLLGILKSEASRKGLHVNTPHSAYLQVMLDQGLVGLLLMLYVLGSIYFTAKKNVRLMSNLVLVMMFMGLTGHTFYPAAESYLWSVGYGVFIFMTGQLRRRIPEGPVTAAIGKNKGLLKGRRPLRNCKTDSLRSFECKSLIN